MIIAVMLHISLPFAASSAYADYCQPAGVPHGRRRPVAATLIAALRFI